MDVEQILLVLGRIFLCWQNMTSRNTILVLENAGSRGDAVVHPLLSNTRFLKFLSDVHNLHSGKASPVAAPRPRSEPREPIQVFTSL